MKYFRFVVRPACLLLLSAFALWGCDTDDGGLTGTEGQTQVFEGQVTDAPGYGKTAGAIEGAVVTAGRVSSQGRVTALAGEATTDASGHYRLEAETSADATLYLLTATKAAFAAQTLAYRQGQTTLRAQPMTIESDAEAAVYLQAKQNDTEGDVTTADVAVYVDAALAAEIATGGTTAADVALVLGQAVAAEGAYSRRAAEGSPDRTGEAQNKKRQAFLTLQADLHGAAQSEGEATALRAFEEAVVGAYVQAGASAEVQAKARQAARASVVRLTEGTSGSARARVSLRQRAALVSSWATAEAIEAHFAAEGASQTRLDALAQARTTLLADLRAAEDEEDLAAAEAHYASTVEATLAAELGVGTLLITTTMQSLTSLKTSLDALLRTTTSAEAVAEAHVAFYTNAEAQARTLLGTSANADLGARVLALLSAS